MTFDEAMDDLRPLVQKLLDTQDEEMEKETVLLKSFLFMFMGLADQCEPKERSELVDIIIIHASAMWIAINFHRAKKKSS